MATFFAVEPVPSWCCSSPYLSLALAARHEECDRQDEERRVCKTGEKAKGRFEDDAVKCGVCGGWRQPQSLRYHQQFTLNKNRVRESINTG
jgi:hypothetical protein